MTARTVAALLALSVAAAGCGLSITDTFRQECEAAGGVVLEDTEYAYGWGMSIAPSGQSSMAYMPIVSSSRQCFAPPAK